MKKLFLTLTIITLLLGGQAMADTKQAIFAGGCFWCMEPPFEKLDGVSAVISGYTNGHVDHPTYQEVSSGRTGHMEAIRVVYDPAKVSYKELVETFWHSVDPTDDGGQFGDRGSQYKTAIFYNDEEEKKIAQDSKTTLDASGHFDQPIVTPILPAKEFFDAEEYHQDYYKKNSFHYKAYSIGSGRKGFLEKTWGK